MSTGIGTATFSTFTTTAPAVGSGLVQGGSSAALGGPTVGAALGPSIRPIPALPPVPMGQTPAVYNFLTAMRNAAQVQFGQTKNTLDRAVTVRDLTTSGGGFDLTGGNLRPNITDPNSPFYPEDPPELIGVLPSIMTNVTFVSTAAGVIITWDQVTGVNNNAIAFVEIWKAEVEAWQFHNGPTDEEWYFPALEITLDGAGLPILSFVNPAYALDPEGNVLAVPTIALHATTLGSIYGDPVGTGKEYVYWLRYRGVSQGTAGFEYSAFHEPFGTLVVGFFDWQAILDELDGQITALMLDSTLQDKIDLIDINTGELAAQSAAIAQEGIDRAAAITAAAAANAASIQQEATDRATRINDVWDYVGTNWAANSIIQDTRSSTTDAAIVTLTNTMNSGDAALASQIQQIIAASGEWYVQPSAPTISSSWTGTVHWLDSNDDNRHYVSTPTSRAASAGWVDVTDTRIDTNVANILTEQQARIAADSAAATVSSNITAQINNSTTGLSAIANNLSGFMSLVNDQGPNGYLAQSSKFTSLQNDVINNATGIAANTTANQNLTSYVNDDGPNGFVQQTLFSTALGSSLLTNLAGSSNLATTDAIDTLETYVDEQGAGGLWTSSSRFTGLEAVIYDSTTGLFATAGAVSDLTAYVNNQGAGGLFQGASRFTSLEADVDNLQTGLSAETTARQTLSAYMENTTEFGFLANNASFTTLETRVTNAEVGVDGVLSAQNALVTDLEDTGAGGYLATTLSGTTLLSDLVGQVTGHLAQASALQGLQTYVDSTLPDGLLATNSKFYNLENTVYDNNTGVNATANALSNLQTTVDSASYPNAIVSASSDFTTLANTVNDPTTGVSATASGFSSLDTMVRANSYGNTLLSQSTDFTSLENAINGPNGNDGISSAVTQLDSYVNNTGTGTFADDLVKTNGIIAGSSLYTDLVADVGSKATTQFVNSAIATEAGARATAITNLFAESGDGTAAISAQIGTEIDVIEGQIQGRSWNKIDNNGNVVGYEFYNGSGDLQDVNTFNIFTDVFSISTRDGWGVKRTPVYMNNNALVLDFSVMQFNGFIPSANIGTISVGDITGFTSDFVKSTIGEGNITNAYIGDTIQSVNYVTGQSGWAIHKNYWGLGSGYAEFANIRARGNIEATSLNISGNARVDTLQIKESAVVVTRYINGNNDQALGGEGNGESWMVGGYGINPKGGRVHYTAGMLADGGTQETGSKWFRIYLYFAYYNLNNQRIPSSGGILLKAQRMELYVNGSTQVNYDFPFQISAVTPAVDAHPTRSDAVVVWAKVKGNGTFRDAWATVSTAKR